MNQYKNEYKTNSSNTKNVVYGFREKMKIANFLLEKGYNKVGKASRGRRKAIWIEAKSLTFLARLVGLMQAMSGLLAVLVQYHRGKLLSFCNGIGCSNFLLG